MTTTNIAILPLYKAQIGVSTDEDLDFAITFTLADGSPLSLAGLSFALSIGSTRVLTSAANGGIAIAGAGLNILSVFWPAASKVGWNGDMPMGLAASDGTYTRSVFQGSSSRITIGWGATSPIQLAQIDSPSATAVAAVAAVAMTAPLAAVAAAYAGAPTIVTASTYAIAGPGWYLVETQSAVVTLPALALGGPIVITDATGSANPDIQVVGTVNGDASGLLISVRGQSVTLGAGASSWWVQ